MKKIKCKLLLVLLFLFVQATNGQTIRTFAGNGTIGYSGDGAAATLSQFGEVFGITSNNLGDIFFADRSNMTIRKVDRFGIITSIASASFGSPNDIVSDNFGNLFVSENYQIHKIDSKGDITLIAGMGKYGSGGDSVSALSVGFGERPGIAIDRYKNVYIADRDNHAVYKVDSLGMLFRIAGTSNSYDSTGDGGPAKLAKLHNPSSIAIDSIGNIYIADFTNNKIRKIDTFGIISSYSHLVDVYRVCLDKEGNLYASAAAGIYKVDSNSLTRIAGQGGYDYGYFGDGGLAINAKIGTVFGMTFDSWGRLFLADFSNYRIRVINNATKIVDFDKNNEIAIYPNPTSGYLNIASSKNICVSIVDMLGTMMLNNCSSRKIDLSAFQAGMYYVIVKDNEGILLKSQKIIIK